MGLKKETALARALHCLTVHQSHPAIKVVEYFCLEMMASILILVLKR